MLWVSSTSISSFTFYRYIGISVICFFIAVLFAFLYLIEAKRQGWIIESLFWQMRQVIMIFHVLFSLAVVMHYLVVNYEFERISFIILESLRDICFFTVFYTFSHQATKFLPSKHRWLRALTFILVTGFIFELLMMISLVLKSESIR